MSTLSSCARRRLTLPLSTLSLLLAACGGGGGGGSGGGGGNAANLEQSLNRLGVDTAATPRLDDTSSALPPDYAPFGSSWALSKTDELLLVGIDSVQTGENFSVVDVTDGQGQASQTRLFGLSDQDAPWAVQRGQSSGTVASRRAVFAADYDGDGLEEIVIAHLTGSNLNLATLDDKNAGFARRDQVIHAASDVNALVGASGDFDGDGKGDIVLALVRDRRCDLEFYEWDGARFVAQPQTMRLDGILASGSAITPRLATGNLDDDRADELALVVNELGYTNSNPVYASRFFVYDDQSTMHGVLNSGTVSGYDQNTQLRVAAVADVAIGNIDGDQRQEVVLGGLLGYVRSCDPIDRFGLALDDAMHGVQPIAGYYFREHINNCPSYAAPRFQFCFVGCPDLDGDGRAEIALDRHVFQDFVDAAPWTEVPEDTLPQDVIYAQGNFGYYDLSTTCYAYGDFTGDDRDDIAVCRQDLHSITVYGLPQTATQVTAVRTVPMTFANAQTPINPVLVAVNVDVDSAVLKYTDGQYKLVFSEPIVLAALAAAPCKAGVGQNEAACSTTFGNTTSSGQERERSVTVSASASVGFKVEDVITQSGSQFKVSATGASTSISSRAYTLSKTVLFTSGANEDTVVFTTVPMDTYTYKIVSHPDPDLIGREVVVRLPRNPITLQAERTFYNSSIAPGSMPIDSAVFSHRIGDPSSYHTVGEKNALLGSNPGLQVGPLSVGQGTGQTELQLQVGEEISTGRTLEVGFEMELEFTGATVMNGISMGTSVGSTLRIQSGRSTTYTGVVGALPAAAFAQNRYQFGLFTYVRRDTVTGRQFQVLDYWVE